MINTVANWHLFLKPSESRGQQPGKYSSLSGVWPKATVEAMITMRRISK
jgi:hypothetical protein